MSEFICFKVFFLDDDAGFHGSRDGDIPEWPPSPLRLFQAFVDAAASRWRSEAFFEQAKPTLEWLEEQKPPVIVSPEHRICRPFRVAVPNNDLDIWARPFSKGGKPKKQPNELKTMKTIHRIQLLGSRPNDRVVNYLVRTPANYLSHLEVLKAAARGITHLGWGVDLVSVTVSAVSLTEFAELPGHRWEPAGAYGTSLRVPTVGTTQALIEKHGAWLARLADNGFRPVAPIDAFNRVRYRRDDDPLSRPHAVFKLVDADDDTVSYAQSKLIHIAGMVKHLAIEMMKDHPPSKRDLREIDPVDWVRAYVGGHQSKEDKDAGAQHTQFSYVPLQSIGMEHTDPGVRRVMIVAPIGDDAWLKHLADRLDGELLKPLPNTTLPLGTRLQRIADNKHDGVRDGYIDASIVWASVTPVILPGHDDHKPEKTRKLIEKALAQSGIDQPCEFEWSAFSQFRKMLPAHKYRKDPNDPSRKILINYVRPDHLLEQSAVHLRITFPHPVPGPITLGAGRHCGFGLLAAVSCD